MSVMTANTDQLVAKLEEARRVHHESNVAVADQVLELLDRFGFRELVRWKLRLELAAEAEVKALPAPADSNIPSTESSATRPKPRPKPKRRRRRTKGARPRCSEPGCDREVKAKGLCPAHYQRLLYRRKREKNGRQPRKRRTTGSASSAPASDSKPAPIGNPKKIGQTVRKAELPLLQKPACAAFENCQEYSDAKGWRGFSCQACAGPGKRRHRPDGR